jgi:ribosome-associated protein
MAAPDFPEQLRDLIIASVEDDKAEGTVVLDLKGKSTLADYIVITSGRSARQVDAMAGHLLSKLKEVGLIGLDAEGTPQCDWVLIDAGDVLVHLFRPEVRAFYNLEKMWGVELPPDFAGFGAPASDFLSV